MPVNNPQQKKLASFGRIEEDCTNGYDSDGELGTFFDANEDEGEQDFDKDSRQEYRPELVEEDKDESTTATPEYEKTCHIPIEDAVIAKTKIADIQ